MAHFLSIDLYFFIIETLDLEFKLIWAVIIYIQPLDFK